MRNPRNCKLKVRAWERQHLAGFCFSSVLVTLLLFQPLYSGASAAVGPRDPFINQILRTLSERAPSDSEMQALTDYLKKHPDDSDSHLAMAQAYNKLGMDGLYAEEISSAWRLSPESLLYLLAALKARVITSDEGKFQELVDEAYNKFQMDPGKLSSLGKLFQANQQIDLSLRFFDRAVAIAPEDREIRLGYCNVLLAKRRYHELLVKVEPLLQSSDSHFLATLLKGIALFNLNRTEEALSYLKMAYSENNKRAEVSEAYYDALMSAGRTREALEPALFTLALQNPRDKHVNVVKAKIQPCVAKASPAQLVEGIEKVRALLPPGQALSFFYFALGDLSDKTGKRIQGSNLYAAGLSQFRYGRAYMRLARDLEILNAASPEQVLELYAQAVILSPEDYEVKASYLRMRERQRTANTDLALKIKHAISSLKYKS